MLPYAQKRLVMNVLKSHRTVYFSPKIYNASFRKSENMVCCRLATLYFYEKDLKVVDCYYYFRINY